MRNLTLGAALTLVAIGGFTGAQAASFTAETVMTHPQHGTQQGRMFVSDQGTRFELTQQGRPMVQIYDANQGVMRVLFPKDRTFMEQKTKPRQAPAAKPTSPCPPAGQAKCEKVKTEEVGNVTAERWLITAPKAQKPTTVWWEPTRHMVIGHDQGNGQGMRMSFMGAADHDGRKVERWQTTYLAPKQKATTSEQLYDPELGIAVRESLPGGAVRELRNIRLVQPDPSWFAVPEGYQRIEPKQQPHGQGGAQPRRQ